jgi:hypothetical protein
VLAETDLKKYVHQEMSALAERMSMRLSGDKDVVPLPPEFDPQIVEPVIITYLQGLFRIVLLSYERPRVERQIDIFLHRLRALGSHFRNRSGVKAAAVYLCPTSSHKHLTSSLFQSGISGVLTLKNSVHRF